MDWRVREMRPEEATLITEHFRSATPEDSVRKTPILGRILNFLSAWDRKQRDRETARLIVRSGGRFTDELERRISDCARPHPEDHRD
jgi:hypothetical protein